MDTFVPIINNSLQLSRAANRAHGPINKTEAIIQCSSFAWYGIVVLLKGKWTEYRLIPVKYAVTVMIVNIIEHMITDHT